MISDKTISVGAKGGEAMSDTRLDIERERKRLLTMKNVLEIQEVGNENKRNDH